MEKLIAALRVQSIALDEIDMVFRDRGFLELMPVILSKVTDPLGPDPGSSVVKTPTIEYGGQELVLTQSMILHKQALAKMGLEKFYVVSPNVRLEHPRRAKTGRHLFEFNQVDFEARDWKMDDVMRFVDEVFVRVIKRVTSDCKSELELWGRTLRVPKAPFKSFTTHELEAKYGKDWEAKASKAAKEPFWAICHKREFYDREDPKKPGHYLNYDLIYPEGYGEALSGAEREWELERILERIHKDKLPLEKYKEYLDLAKNGLVPTAGAGFGVERLVRFLVGAKHVGDIQPFRKVPGDKVDF